MTSKSRSLQELMRLQDKTVFITGGAGHLGTAMCEALAKLGANIVIGSRDTDKSAAIASVLSEKFGVQASALPADITDPDNLEAALERIEKKHGRLGILINNAWSGKKNSFESISPGPFPFSKILDNAEFIGALKAKTMLNRIGTPEDLKGPIALLCSDAAGYITGQNICVDGGWTSW